MSTAQKHPKVFISYSHDLDVWTKARQDPETQKKRVLGLAERLRYEGVDCVIDQHIQNPPEGWPRWMTNQIEGADFVIVVATETYNRRFKGDEVPNRGLGAQWEGAIITQHLYNANGKNLKFIPVIFEPGESAHIPVQLLGATYYNVSHQKGYDDLYYYLTNQPPYVPPLGQKRLRPARNSDTVDPR